MQTGLLYGIVGLAVVGWAISRQVVRRPVTPKRLFVLPAVFAVLAPLTDHELGHRLGSPAAMGFFALGVAVAVGMGAARSATMRVWWTPAGVLSQGGGRTVLLWLVTIAFRVAVLLIGAQFGVGEGSGEVMLFVAITIATQNALLFRRAGRLSQAPATAPEAPVAAADAAGDRAW